MYAKAMKVMGMEFDERHNPRAVHWLPENQRLNYFSLYDRISQHVSWILETSELSIVVNIFLTRNRRRRQWAVRRPPPVTGP